MWKTGSVAVVLFLVAGCGLAPSIDTIKPSPSPDTPDIISLQKIPAQAYWQAYAGWVDAKLITTPQGLAQNARQLNLAKLLSDDDFAKIDPVFSGAAKDTRTLTKDDSAKLRGMR